MTHTSCCISTVIHVEGLELLAHVGLEARERSTPQCVIVDIDCMLTDPAVVGDELTESIDYVPIVHSVRKLALRKRRRLLETFAQEIAEVCFKSLRIIEARIRIRKPRKMHRCEAVGITRTFRQKGETP